MAIDPKAPILFCFQLLVFGGVKMVMFHDNPKLNLFKYFTLGVLFARCRFWGRFLFSTGNGRRNLTRFSFRRKRDMRNELGWEALQAGGKIQKMFKASGFISTQIIKAIRSSFLQTSRILHSYSLLGSSSVDAWLAWEAINKLANKNSVN